LAANGTLTMDEVKHSSTRRGNFEFPLLPWHFLSNSSRAKVNLSSYLISASAIASIACAKPISRLAASC
jgi:hypothetical protein